MAFIKIIFDVWQHNIATARHQEDVQFAEVPLDMSEHQWWSQLNVENAALTCKCRLICSLTARQKKSEKDAITFH